MQIVSCETICMKCQILFSGKKKKKKKNIYIFIYIIYCLLAFNTYVTVLCVIYNLIYFQDNH